jgi:hypothetical protein
MQAQAMLSFRAASSSGCAASPSAAFTTQLLVLARDQFRPAQAIEGAKFRSGHEPNARLVGDGGLRPLLERGDERVLSQHGEFSEDLTIIMNALWCLQLAWALLVSTGGLLSSRTRFVGSGHLTRGRQRHFFPICSPSLRWCSTASLSPKSSSSKIWRISISLSPSCGLGQRLIHSIASAFDSTWRIQ